MKYGHDSLTSTENEGQLIFEFYEAGRAGPAAKQNGSSPERLDNWPRNQTPVECTSTTLAALRRQRIAEACIP